MSDSEEQKAAKEQMAIEKLMSVSEAHYGDGYKDVFLTQYRDFISSASDISDRRHEANKFFSSINSVFLLASGLVPTENVGFSWYVALAGALLCLIWMHMIASYKELNSAKFKVILEMEKHLPAATYASEYLFKKSAESSNLSSVESMVPKLFIGAYFLVYVAHVVSQNFKWFQ